MITGRALDWMVVRVEMPISAKFLTRWGSRLSWSKVLTEKTCSVGAVTSPCCILGISGL